MIRPDRSTRVLRGVRAALWLLVLLTCLTVAAISFAHRDSDTMWLFLALTLVGILGYQTVRIDNQLDDLQAEVDLLFAALRAARRLPAGRDVSLDELLSPDERDVS